MDPLTIASLVMKGYDTANDLIYNKIEDPLGNTKLQDEALRGTTQDRHLINQLGELIFTGNGLWGTTAAERETQAAVDEIRNNQVNFSGIQNNTNLLNSWDNNALQQNISVPQSNSFINGAKLKGVSNTLNREINRANQSAVDSFYNTALNNQTRSQRQAMMNYFAEGGSMDNGVNIFNVGNQHENNPYGGIPQGIASDGLPNKVEQDELKYNNYIYSNRLKPSRKLLKDFNLPEKYAGLSFAKIGKKLQKESEDRANDSISKQTLDDWMSRLQQAQEGFKTQKEERELVRAFDALPDETKAALTATLAQQEIPQMEQPMFAEGGAMTTNSKNKYKFNEESNPLLRELDSFTHGIPLNINYSLNAPTNPINPLTGNTAWGLGQLSVKSPIVYDRATNQILRDNTVPNPLNIEWHGSPSAEINTNTNTNTSANKRTWKFNAEDLRKAPVVGAGIGALTAALQPIDYNLANDLSRIASKINPISAPALGGYRRYTPYDINLGDSENLAMQAAQLRQNRGQNRATQAAINAAVTAQNQKVNAARNFAARQANEANRLGVDNYNLGIDQTNAGLAQAYDQINTNRLAQRLGIEQNAAQARDVARTGWANMLNATTENFYNQLGNVGKDTWNRNQYQTWLSQHQAVKNVMDGTSTETEKINEIMNMFNVNKAQAEEIFNTYNKQKYA